LNVKEEFKASQDTLLAKVMMKVTEANLEVELQALKMKILLKRKIGTMLWELSFNKLIIITIW
jgi:uncharacterized coiled-coil protein SlyX